MLQQILESIGKTVFLNQEGLITISHLNRSLLHPFNLSTQVKHGTLAPYIYFLHQQFSHFSLAARCIPLRVTQMFQKNKIKWLRPLSWTHGWPYPETKRGTSCLYVDVAGSDFDASSMWTLTKNYSKAAIVNSARHFINTFTRVLKAQCIAPGRPPPPVPLWLWLLATVFRCSVKCRHLSCVAPSDSPSVRGIPNFMKTKLYGPSERIESTHTSSNKLTPFSDRHLSVVLMPHVLSANNMLKIISRA